MFYIITKKTLLIICIIIIMLVMPLSVSALVMSIAPKPTYTIVIDPGHGGVDEGVHGNQTNVSESELNLAISKNLQTYFKNAGFRVIMTRNNNNGLYGIKSVGFKNRDMKARKKIIQNASPDIILSIHMNYYSAEVRRGLQVFYTNTEQSEKLAREIQHIVNVNINQPIIHRDLTCLYGDFFILNCSKAPSVLVECGFLSNPQDEVLLTDPKHQDELSYNIFSGVIRYIEYL